VAGTDSSFNGARVLASVCPRTVWNAGHSPQSRRLRFVPPAGAPVTET